MLECLMLQAVSSKSATITYGMILLEKEHYVFAANVVTGTGSNQYTA